MTSSGENAQAAERQFRIEQAHLDEVYQRIDQVRDDVSHRLDRAISDPIAGTPGSRTERDALVALHSRRLRELDSVDDRLCFGRLDLVDDVRRYVGRIGVSDAQQNPLVMDWRADAAAPFYRATAADPEGVVRRRHIATSNRRVTGLDDDVLIMDALTDETRETITGNDSLLTALDSARTGQMRDIVSTIQTEQDVIIRSESRGVLVVQGGPGTGKSVVALHRVAYLLYAQRDRIARAGALVVGPNDDFLSYIDKVLPALGETGVVLASLGHLYPGINATATDTNEAAALKGSAMMADVIKAAVANRRRVPNAAIPLRVDGVSIELTPADVQAAMRRARDTRRPYNLARTTFAKDLLTRLAGRMADKMRLNVDQETLQGLVADLREEKDVKREINLCWMPRSPEQLIGELLTNPGILAAAAPSLSLAERTALLRHPEDPWTVSDIPLLDEAAELLGELATGTGQQNQAQTAERAREVAFAAQTLADAGPAAQMITAEQYVDRFAGADAYVPVAERAGADRTWAYGHVVVDEAQELTPMQWRTVMRKCPSKSMTIVGDPAQRSAPGAAGSWADALSPHVQDRWRLTELTINYRTPQSIMDTASAALRLSGTHDTTPKSVRPGRWPVEAIALTDPARGLTEALVREAALIEFGTVAVIAGEVNRDVVAAAIEGAQAITESINNDRVRISWFTPTHVKGLEFDSIVLFEPSAALADSANPAHDLYVAMTRPTQRLVVASSLPLPDFLARAIDENT
mgnify:FL=1